jgi:hypothetical protein
MQHPSLPANASRVRDRAVARGERLLLDSGIALLAVVADWGLTRAMGQLPDARKATSQKGHHRPLGFSVGFRRH